MPRRSTIDQSLRRRAPLADVQAARHHGEETEQTCPVCRGRQLTRANSVHGDALGTVVGQAGRQAELDRTDAMQDGFAGWALEVCRGCGWNHPATSYVLGAVPEPGRDGCCARRRAAPD